MKPRLGTLLKACGRGNQQACNIAKKIHAIYAGSVVQFSSANGGGQVKHPNKMPFSGTLLICDEPSDKPPHGSQGHRILVTSEVAKEKLHTLPGMAVNYDPSDMDEHETRNKVGIITKAWMEGHEVKIAGFVWKKDFPEAERDLKRRDLGTSMELADVYVDNEHADVWDLTDFSFTGATILKRDAAAYTKTSLAASSTKTKSLAAAAKMAAVNGEEGEKVMSQKNKEKEKRHVAAARERGTSDGSLALVTQALSASLGPALSNALAPIVNEIKASNEAVLEGVEELKGLHLIAAAADKNDDDDDDEVVLHAAKEEASDDDDMAAASDDDDDDMAAASDDDDDDMTAKGEDSSSSDSSDASSSNNYEAMEDLEIDPADEEPGEVNKDASNKGSKKKVTKPPKQGEHLPGNVAKGRLSSAGAKGKGMKKAFPGLEAAAVRIEKLHASNRKLVKTINAMAQEAKVNKKRFKTQIKTMNAQLENFAEKEGRRSSLPVECMNLASKAGLDLGEIKASGQVLSIETWDKVLAIGRSNGIVLQPEQSIAMKNLLTEQGLLEDGAVNRNYGR